MQCAVFLPQQTTKALALTQKDNDCKQTKPQLAALNSPFFAFCMQTEPPVGCHRKYAVVLYSEKTKQNRKMALFFQQKESGGFQGLWQCQMGEQVKG